jgi:DNA invertase Pin-like site-specific DNA recombinase
MIAAYVRVSSRSQTYGMQRDAIERASAARGDEIRHWFEEKLTGAKLDRPGLSSLRECVRQGEIRKLYVYRLDRLSRSGIRDTLATLEELKNNGCTLVTVADGFDLEGPASEIVIAVMAWAAKMERLAIGERICAARARVESQGGAWGRPKRVSPELVRRIREAIGTVRQLSARFHVPRSTVSAVLSGKGPYKIPGSEPEKLARARARTP